MPYGRMRDCTRVHDNCQSSAYKIKLGIDGCIVWNAVNKSLS